MTVMIFLCCVDFSFIYAEIDTDNLTNAKTIRGDQEFLAPDGTTETGHVGNGYARITLIK